MLIFTSAAYLHNFFFVQTKFAGICHTDLHMWEDKFIVRGGAVIGTAQTFDDFKFPLVLGL